MSTTPSELTVDVILNIKLEGIKLIEASAGTGKTYTIANLYLRHILSGKTSAEILVVTFTKAATEELRGRIRLRLYQSLTLFRNPKQSGDLFLSRLLAQYQALDGETQNQYILRLQLALRSMDEASISTIHSFCQRALGEHALAGKYYFDSEILVDDSELWQSVTRDWWRRQTYLLGQAELGLLLDSVKRFSTFSGWLNEIRKKEVTRYVPDSVDSLEECLKKFSSLEVKLIELSGQWKENSADLKNILRDSKVLSRAKTLPYHADNIDSFIRECDEYFNSDQKLSLSRNFKYLASEILHQSSTAAKRGQDANLDNEFFTSAGRIYKLISELKSQIKINALNEAFDYISDQIKRLKEDNRLLAYQDQLDLLLQALVGKSGEDLRRVLRQQFPVAMIDEFQDTDATQYEIFRNLYYQQNDLNLTLIGDPKQAIYSFRGGDIFTYMKARRLEGLQQYSLQTNWRSHQGLVDSVNRFFDYRDDSFIYSDSIPFTNVKASPLNASAMLTIDGATAPAVSLWHIPLKANGKPFNKGDASELLNLATANEIAALIKGGQAGSVSIDDRPLQSGDIAILVRTARQGESLRQALSARGINSVTIGKDKVFESDEAIGLYSLLDAVAHHQNRQLVHRALSSSLLNFEYSQIADLVGDDSRWIDWSSHFPTLHQLWLTRGFIPMFQQMLQIFALGQKLAARDQAERRLTNLLHLAELLQQQSNKSAGIDNLLNWLHRQMNEAGSEETELRLESDQSLVKIVTIHKSKGLEYPVVFLPYLWSCRSFAASKTGVLHYHDSDFASVLDLGSSEFDQHCLRADKERLAEDIRLLYVALTRARSKIYLAWGVAGSNAKDGNSSQTALAYLLHSSQKASDLDSAFASGVKNPASIYDELQSFVNSSNGNIELTPLPSIGDEAVLLPKEAPATVLQARQFHAISKSAWRINSFSSLTRDIHQVTHSGSAASTADSIFNFPAGSHVGLLLHSIFENIDFDTNIEAQCRDLIPRLTPRFGLNIDSYHIILIDWIKQVLETPLIQPGLSLSVLSSKQRLNEITFDFSLDYADMNQLNALLVEISGTQLEGLNAPNFRGLITGVVDLVFEYRGKYYLADYKSNLLGSSLQDYSPEHLQQAMFDRRYDLQLLIYSIALHRYLGQRVPDYDYEAHFGGAYYLFIRAMRPDTGSKYGVHFERPALANIEALDQLFANTAANIGDDA